MKSVNKVILIGNVGSEPEVRYTQKGDPILSFSLATSEKYNDKEETQWHRVSVFGKLAGVMKDYIEKGKPLYVEGQVVYEDWTDKEGNKRNSTKIKVGFGGTIVLLGSKGDGTKSARKPAGSASGSGAEIPVDSNFKASDDDVPF